MPQIHQSTVSYSQARYTLHLCFFLMSVLFFTAHSGYTATSGADLPGSTRVILAKTGKLIKEKNYKAAIALITDYQKREEKHKKGYGKGYFHAEVYHVLGVCCLLENNLTLASRALDQALEKDPKHVPARLNRAKAAYELGDYRKAAESFVTAFDIASEKNPEHLYFAAVAYLLAKENRLSIALFDRLLALCPDTFRPQWRENLVHALLEAGEGKQALPHIMRLIKDNQGEKQARWRELLLNQYLHLDMYDEALSLANRLTELEPTEPKWWRAQVHIHLYRNNYRPALTALLLLGYLEPLSDQEQRLTADLYLHLGVPKMAVPFYSTMLKKKTTPQLLSNVLFALQQLGEEERAIYILGKFGGQPLSPELLMQKADLLYRVGDYAKAAELYLQIAASDGKNKSRAIQMAEYAKVQANQG